MTEQDRHGEAPGPICRRLIRAADRAALATVERESWPHASLVLVACDHGARPVVLISTLADHTRNILADDRVSLLYDGTGGLDDPLTGARVSVQGRAVATEDEALRARYIARHPRAAGYVDFADFSFYRIEVERAHLVAGFGRIRWVEADDMILDASAAAELAAAEPGILEHMNDDHGDAIDLFANVLLERPGDGWTMTGIDPEGVDLRHGGEIARLDFDHPIADLGAARTVLVDLANRARESG